MAKKTSEFPPILVVIVFKDNLLCYLRAEPYFDPDSN
jgi:hypothetical protein